MPFNLTILAFIRKKPLISGIKHTINILYNALNFLSKLNGSGTILAQFSPNANVDSSQFYSDHHLQPHCHFEFCCYFNVHCQHAAHLFAAKVEKKYFSYFQRTFFDL